MRDVNGQPVMDPNEADMFSFDFVDQAGKDYGTVVCFFGEDESLQLFYGDNVGRGMDKAPKEEWYQFLQQLSMFAKRNRLRFDLKNLNKLRYTQMGQAALREGLFESWTGKKNISYNAKPDAVRLMIRHNRDIQEGEQRFRHIQSLFVETSDGERFRLPFKSLAGGKAMCEHVRAGGKPYDPQGCHIAEMVIFESETLVEEARSYLSELKSQIKSLGTRRGYAKYFESWNPADITESDLMIEQVRNLMTTQDVDARIEDAIPILARLPGARVTEADVFESWANELVKRI
jgi:hypothetical protein